MGITCNKTNSAFKNPLFNTRKLVSVIKCSKKVTVEHYTFVCYSVFITVLTNNWQSNCQNIVYKHELHYKHSTN